MTEILQQEVLIRKLKEECMLLKAKNPRSAKLDKLQSKISLLKKQQVSRLIGVLSQENQELAMLVKENQALLMNKQLTMAVTNIGGGIMSSYTKELQGNIHENGFLYCKASSVSNSVEDALHHWKAYFFRFKVYPKELQGEIDCLGEIRLRVSRFGYSFIGSRVADSFIGSVNEEGKIVIVPKVNGWEPFGQLYISKLVADPFRGNQRNRNRFVENVRTIKKLVSNYRESLDVGR